MISSGQKPPFLFLGGEILTFSLTFLLSIYFYSDNRYPDLNWFILSGFILLILLIRNWRRLGQFTFRQLLTFRFYYYAKVYFTLLGLILLYHLFLPLPISDRHLLVGLLLGLPLVGLYLSFLILSLVKQGPKSEKPPRKVISDDHIKYTLIAGVGNMAETVEKSFYDLHGSGARIKGFIQCKKEECRVKQDKVVGKLKHIRQYLQDNPVDEIVIALPVKPSKKVRNILEIADYHGIRVKYVPDYQGLLGTKYKTTRYGRMDVVNVRQTPLDETFSFFLKNSFDKVFASVALILLAPVFLAIAVLIKLESPGPIFYAPTRIGKAGKPFRVFKFRSMRENDAATGGLLSTQKDDPRITRLGRILRKYSLDELPQFLNVLLGEMSVVGPRPHRSVLNQQFQESVDKYMIRHYFKPGITGWAQVNGWRGPTDTAEQKAQRTRHDLWYVENWSLWLDIKIIYLTIFSRKTYTSAF
ncbi:MAG: exopolysaccharide biosynthesis polyprenyl glycosylphosphotransferase [Adhaeribacter sp.]